MTIVPPAKGTEFINPWTLNALSNSFADIGTWMITLQATLDNYSLSTTSVISSGIVQDPCFGTVIQPIAPSAMTVTIYDSVATAQPFFAWNDSFSVLMKTPGICGDKAYLSD
jgi:hypothetical protein